MNIRLALKSIVYVVFVIIKARENRLEQNSTSVWLKGKLYVALFINLQGLLHGTGNDSLPVCRINKQILYIKSANAERQTQRLLLSIQGSDIPLVGMTTGQHNISAGIAV